MNLKKLFNPQSIAIVGASPEDGKIGNVIMKNIFGLGYKGQVYLVNPKYDDIFSQKCYKSLSEIEEEVDLAVFAIPAKFIMEEINNNASKIKNYVIISAGFSETGEDGKKMEAQLAKLAKENELNILGPNCLGFIIPKIKLNASFAGGMPEAGHISFISQSGALAVALMDIAKAQGIKFSNIISVGNKMSLSESELLEYMVEDADTKVIGMYLEGIKDGERFMKVAEKVAKLKPVIILKAGKSAKAQKAISSHTGALAGDDEIISAVFKKTGVLRANNLEEFFDLFNLIDSSKNPPGKKSVIITNAGGVGVLTADAYSGKSIELMELSNDTKKELRDFLPAEASIENPIDLLGDADSERYAKALKCVSGISEAGSIICVLTPQDQTPVLQIAEEIIKFKEKFNKVIVTVFLGGERVEQAIDNLKENGVINFSFPDEAVSALNGYFVWNEFKKLKIKADGQVINEKRKEKAQSIIQKAAGENRTALYFSEAKEIMEMYGVNTVECAQIESENNLPINFPAVIKVDSDKVLHKTEKRGLILDIKNAEELSEAVREMRNNFPGNRLISQPMAARGTELIIGIKRDANFGPVVLYGLGGIYTEMLKMVDYLIPPVSLGQIEDSLMQGKMKFLFEGARSQKKYDFSELAKTLHGIVIMAIEIPQVREFDINPLVIYNNGRAALAVDIKIII